MHVHEHKDGSVLKVGVILVFNLVIALAQMVAGIFAGSLALLSDAIHNLSDVGTVTLSFLAKNIARRESTSAHTYGYKRAEILAAFVNAIVLIGIAFLVIREAVERFFVPAPSQAHIMVIVGLGTFVVNGISSWLLHRDAKHSLNMRSSYLHLLYDAIFSLVVAGGGVVLLWRPVFWLDPLLSVVIALWMAKEAWKVVRETVDILMQGAAPLDYQALQRVIEEVPGVKNIHHVHTWRSDEHTFYLEAHIEMDDQRLSEACEIGVEVEKRLLEFGISHVTLQYETDRCREKTLFVKG